MDPSKQEEAPLNVVVVGAGIGGLAAALGLRLASHHVRIFEKRAAGNEVGAAIVIPANIYGLLKKLGVNPEEHGSNTEDIRSFYSKSGHLMFENDYTGYGGAARLIHRVDLYEALKGEAVAQGVQIDFASPIESVDSAAASVTLSNGERISADVIIGADGVHSVVRSSIVPDAPSPSPFQLSMFRMLIPCAKLAESEQTKRFVDPPGKMSVFLGDDGRRVVNYPCRSNTIMNVAALFPSSLAKPRASDADADAHPDLKKHMLSIFADFHPATVALLAAAEDPGTWTLYDLPALSTWTRGSAALMGDAAHPLLPYAAQGGAQALEDAAALAVLLGRGTTPAQVPERLRLYFDVRHERAEWVQRFARCSELGVEPELKPAQFYERVYDHDAWGFAEVRLREYQSTGREG